MTSFHSKDRFKKNVDSYRQLHKTQLYYATYVHFLKQKTRITYLPTPNKNFNSC